MLAKLDILGTSEPPAYVGDWDLSTKTDAILKWIHGNYVRGSKSSHSYLFEEYDNDDDLELELSMHSSTSAEIVKTAWGLFLPVQEFDEVVALVDKEDDEEWLPLDHLILVEELEEDDDVTLEELQARVPMLLSNLGYILEAVPATIGHNNPPLEMALPLSDIRELRDALKEFQVLRAFEVEDQSNWLLWLAEKAREIGSAVMSYSMKTTDTFVQKASESAGAELGKWGTRAGILLLAGSSLQALADDIIKLIIN